MVGNKVRKKALCSLKQSLRAWSGRFAKVMLVMNYKETRGGALFIKYSNIGVTVC